MTPAVERKDTAGSPRGSGAERGLGPSARRFLAERKGVLARLAAWSVAESVQTFLVGYGVAQALDRGFLAGDTAAGLGWLAVAACAVLLGAPVIRGVFAELAGLTEPLRDRLVRRAVDRTLARALSRPEGGDRAAVSRLTNQVEMVRDSFAGLVLTLRSFVFTAAGALAGLLSLHPALVLVVVPPLAAGVALFLLTLRPMAAAQRRALAADEALGDHAARVRKELRDVTACGILPETSRDGERLVARAAVTSRVLARWAAVRALALGAAAQLPVLLLLVTVPWLLARGVTTGALLGAFTYLAQALLPAVHSLVTAIGAAGSRLLVVLERFTGPEASPPVADAPPLGWRAGTPRPPAPARSRAAPAVELCSVTVRYGARAEPVLDALDLRVEEGEHVAVVGPSGIGKSTLTRLVAGLCVPRAGTVRVAGREVAGRPPAELRSLRVLAPQQAYVFTGTVRDNLTYLRPGASRAAIEAAVLDVGAAPLVERLGGLDAGLRPDELSQGERQLLVLARAHLSTARLLLLDEATCHLDAASEERAERALARRPGTLLVVAHRMSSAVRADRVLLLDGVRAAFGTHEELLGRSPLYRDLVGHWSRT
ncbi:ATP-binding cassette domain-containing protein [Streptomyces sp. M92]|uniref:ATP-binding cassette domain-containing protein n=1 Tax=Streptomyces sp. M92 TaxID=2944250 RepID=UPI00234A20BD|nr:ABC transporter ATP-binding protein [Streptomyces sp. M92]WCN05029.1 ABC transporter ATP-binding protein/permease [Streptomyces sp. M92]